MSKITYTPTSYKLTNVKALISCDSETNQAPFHGKCINKLLSYRPKKKKGQRHHRIPKIPQSCVLYGANSKQDRIH